MNPSMRSFGWSDVARLGVVQACLGAMVVLATSTLNRIMVVELALPALVPGLLVGFHYAIQMVRPRMGFGADRGRRCTPWMIGGVITLALGGNLASWGTIQMGQDHGTGLAICLVAFGCILMDRDRTRRLVAREVLTYVDDRTAMRDIGKGTGPFVGLRPWRWAAGRALSPTAVCAPRTVPPDHRAWPAAATVPSRGPRAGGVPSDGRPGGGLGRGLRLGLPRGRPRGGRAGLDPLHGLLRGLLLFRHDRR